MQRASWSRPDRRWHALARRCVAAVLLLALPPQLGCTVYGPAWVRPAQLTPAERSQPGEPRLVGVVTAWGRRYALDSMPRPVMLHDTLRACVGGATYILRRSDIKRMLMTGPGRDTVAANAATLDDATDVALGPRVRKLRTAAGTEVAFDRTRAVYVAADSVHGMVAGAPAGYALRDVAEVTVTRPDGVAGVASTVLIVGASLFLLGAVLKAGGCCISGWGRGL